MLVAPVAVSLAGKPAAARHATGNRVKQLGEISYRSPAHRDLPHILNMSGGRSSAMLALLACEEGILDADRRDVILFANTSAEHPGTYKFSARIKHETETQYGIPCFWYEFCTVEDAATGVRKGGYRRVLQYRLVRPVPVETDPDGYRHSGELFEELIAFQKMLPNPHARTCTAKLKLFPSHLLLSEWLGGTSGPAHAGHHWSTAHGAPRSLIDPKAEADQYVASGGTGGRKLAHDHAATLKSLPSCRPAQRWQDFTSVPIPESNGKPVPIRGTRGVKHVKLLGLRADEQTRIQRIESRSFYAEGATTARCTVRTQPPGERPYFPLAQAEITNQDVLNYWQSQPFDLNIPEHAGNCVGCFMKGTSTLRLISQTPDPQATPGTPTDMSWWADFEERHARIAPARNGRSLSRFGFLGVNSPPLRELIDEPVPRVRDRYTRGTPACDCTD